MPAKTFYMLGSAAVAPGWFGAMQDGGTPPAGAITTFRWVVGTTALSTPYWRARIGAATAANVAAAASQIASASGPIAGTGATNTTAGDSFMSQAAYSNANAFAAGPWSFNFGMQGANPGATGRINFRLWASANANGSAARELTGGMNPGSTVGPMASGTTYNSAYTWNAPAVTLSNEYLFLQVEWQNTAVGTGTTTNVVFYVSACTVVTPNYAPPGGAQARSTPALLVGV